MYVYLYRSILSNNHLSFRYHSLTHLCYLVIIVLGFSVFSIYKPFSLSLSLSLSPSLCILFLCNLFLSVFLCILFLCNLFLSVFLCILFLCNLFLSILFLCILFLCMPFLSVFSCVYVTGQQQQLRRRVWWLVDWRTDGLPVESRSSEIFWLFQTGKITKNAAR